jgi:hypothetical protein
MNPSLMVSSFPEVRHYARRSCKEWRRGGTDESIPDEFIISRG